MNDLSEQILAGKVEKVKAMVLDVFDGKIVFREPIKEIEREKLNV